MLSLLLVLQLANTLSNVTVGTSIGLDTLSSYRCVDRKHCFVAQTERTGINIAAAEIIKHLIHKERPDHSDDLSFYSEHTSLTAMNPKLEFSIPLTFGTGYFRIAAKKHDIIDVLVGAGVGFVTGRFIR